MADAQAPESGVIHDIGYRHYDGERGGRPGQVPVPHDRREDVVRRQVVVDAEPHLLEVVGALRTPGRLARRLDGGQEQGDQDGDDRNHHQQLDEREPATTSDLHVQPLRM